MPRLARSRHPAEPSRLRRRQAFCHTRAVRFFPWPDIRATLILRLPAPPVAFAEHAAVSSTTLSPPISVLLVDDQQAILSGVSALVDSEAPRMLVAGHARSAHAALELAHSLRPDVIVLDVELGGDDGLALVPRLRQLCNAAIIVFTCVTDAAVRRRARLLGCAGFVSKTAPAKELIALIEAGDFLRRSTG